MWRGQKSSWLPGSDFILSYLLFCKNKANDCWNYFRPFGQRNTWHDCIMKLFYLNHTILYVILNLNSLLSSFFPFHSRHTGSLYIRLVCRSTKIKVYMLYQVVFVKWNLVWLQKNILDISIYLLSIFTMHEFVMSRIVEDWPYLHFRLTTEILQPFY